MKRKKAREDFWKTLILSIGMFATMGAPTIVIISLFFPGEWIVIRVARHIWNLSPFLSFFGMFFAIGTVLMSAICSAMVCEDKNCKRMHEGAWEVIIYGNPIVLFFMLVGIICRFVGRHLHL